ncbi:MAG: hypothetical protein BGO29_00530 [Bacteroidales bacterium 36-12]|nr:MAG: hypothetical protein BGO29_00530 [Bacteroidales bacterium 36-12]
MDKVKLMNRIDTKFMVPLDKLEYLLQKATENYRVVEISGHRTLPYSSIYFDTEDYHMYTIHHNGKLNRQKIRMRSYLSSGVSFLEIKTKNNKRRTKKKRIQIDSRKFEHILLEEAEKDLITSKTPFNPDELSPSLQNFFSRITLVDKKETERVTLDINLQYRLVNSSECVHVKNLVIVELKQDGNNTSDFKEWLLDLSVLPKGMSKYCLGMVLTHDNIKTNRFKQKLRYINKLTGIEQLSV